MAKKEETEKKVRINKKQFSAIIREEDFCEKEFSYGEGEATLEFKARKAIPFFKKIEMVEYALAVAFSAGDESLKSYSPMFVEIAKGYGVLKYYTNLLAPTDSNDMWLLMKNSDLYSDVLSYVRGDVEDVFKAIDEIAEAKKDYYIRRSDEENSLKKLMGFADAFGDKLKNVDIEALIGALGTLKETSPEKIMDSIIKNKEDSKPN